MLTEIFALLETEGWRYSADTGWKDWDVQIYGNQFWSITVRTVTEYHGGPKCLTRVHLGSKPVVTTVLVNAVILSILLYRTARQSQFRHWIWPGIVLKAAYFIFLMSMFARATPAQAPRRGVDRGGGEPGRARAGAGEYESCSMNYELNLNPARLRCQSSSSS